ncbi:MAG: penicillin acylase family protein [Deltaproteobacteria bacterium]|nr:penicillin acylase family protein [Deltaproteobacteria bacterium]
MKKLFAGWFGLLLVLGCFALPAAASLETTRDAQGIWFVNGPEDASLAEVFAEVGYAVACDRLWQAETFRRAGLGTLAEILGPEQLETDIFVRTLGYSQAELEAAYAAFDEESRAVIGGYCSGFNRRLQEIAANPALLPFEFAALGFMPQPWTPTDVLAWQALMLRKFDCEALSRGQLDNAVLYMQLLGKHFTKGPAMFADLRWTNDPSALTYIDPLDRNRERRSSPFAGSPALPEAAGEIVDLRAAASTVNRLYQRVFANLEAVGANAKMGSYAWAISGSRTASGNPMLYSGPQMGFSVPAIIGEGSINAGGLRVSGAQIAGLPGIVVGRTPHHAWSMQVGHAHTVDYYLESPAAVTLDRMEIFKVAGGDEVSVPVFRSPHGPIVNPLPYDPASYVPSLDNPIVAWKYSHRDLEHGTIKAYLDLARAQSPEEFGSALERVGLSQHFCYVDVDGNVAYWMSGREPVRPAGEYRFPQNFIAGLPPAEWDAADFEPLPHVLNPSKGYVCGWNNKCSTDRPGSFNSISSNYFYGPFHRAQVIEDYLASHDHLTFAEVRDLALNIAATDSHSQGGNPWAFVKDYFSAVVMGSGNQTCKDLLSLTNGFDGHFCDDWVAGDERSFAWFYTKAWIEEVLRLTFADELDFGDSTYLDQPQGILFNVLLHAMAGEQSGIVNQYDWFQNRSDLLAPQALPVIILKAQFTALSHTPWFPKRGEIKFQHAFFAGTPYDPLHVVPFGSRSTYAHCVEYSASGPVRIESMFPLGQSGNILVEPELKMPIFDQHFYSMTRFYDSFSPRPFPLFQ